MRKIVVAGWMVISVMLACTKKNADPAGLSLTTNPIQMKVGDSWLYRRVFITPGSYAAIGVPDTLTGYSWFQVSKDTTIDSLSYLIVEGADYDIAQDSIQQFPKRFALNFSDSGIIMYQFNITGVGSGFMSGVMKQLAPNVSILAKNYGTALLKQIELNKLLVAENYDSSVFYDLVYPIVFPLSNNRVYVYRDSGDLHGNLYYQRKFLGLDTLILPIGTFEVYKLEWLANAAMAAAGYHLTDSIYACDWVGQHGLLKRYIYTSPSPIYGALGNVVDSAPTFDITTLIGNTDINPDTLVPWGKKGTSP